MIGGKTSQGLIIYRLPHCFTAIALSHTNICTAQPMKNFHNSPETSRLEASCLVPRPKSQGQRGTGRGEVSKGKSKEERQRDSGLGKIRVRKDKGDHVGHPGRNSRDNKVEDHGT